MVVARIAASGKANRSTFCGVDWRGPAIVGSALLAARMRLNGKALRQGKSEFKAPPQKDPVASAAGVFYLGASGGYVGADCDGKKKGYSGLSVTP